MMAVLTSPLSVAAQSQATDTPIVTDHISEFRIAAFNAVLTSTFAVARGVIDGEVRTVGDAARHAAYGAATGLTFFEAKRRIGLEQEMLGLALAYSSASVMRNVGEGRHPFATICAGPGPIDVCWRTGLQPYESPGLRIEPNGVGIAATAYLAASGMTPRIRHGTLYFESEATLGSHGDGWVRTGYTFGRSIVLTENSRANTWRHELVHFVQNLQIASVTPRYTYRELRATFVDSDLSGQAFDTRRWDLQIDWLFLAVGGLNLLVPYEKQWNEIEAYRLSEPSPKQGWCIGPVYCPQ
jgi:hypothetical protein